jgi:NitT/TauT family transport system permease protein
MKAALVRFLPLLLIALLWEIAPRIGLVSALALPPLSAVLSAWVELLRDGELLTNGATSLYRAGVGLALAIAVGATLGVFMA